MEETEETKIVSILLGLNYRKWGGRECHQKIRREY